jgi:hypothetical protein
MRQRRRPNTFGVRQLGIRVLAPLGTHQGGDKLVLSLIAIVGAIVWMAFAMGCETGDKHEQLQKGEDVPQQGGESIVQPSIVGQDAAVPLCPVAGPKGPWGDYQIGDLPRGNCSDIKTCIVWTKDSCPGTDAPGPGIKWKCVCDSKTWRCDEQERTKTVCIPR